MNEIELRIFNAEKGRLEALLGGAEEKVNSIDNIIKNKEQVLETYDYCLRLLGSKEDFETILLDVKHKEDELATKLKYIEDKIKELDEREKDNQAEADRLAELRKELTEEKERNEAIAAENARNAAKNAEEREELEKRQSESKSIFSGIGEKISSLNPLKSIGSTWDKIMLVGKVTVGAFVVGTIAKAVTPVVNMIKSIKNLLKGSNNDNSVKS